MGKKPLGLILMVFLSLVQSSVIGQRPKLISTIAPSSLLNPNIPTLLLSLQYKPLNHWAVVAGYGFQTPDLLFKWNDNVENLKHSRFQAELRYYLTAYHGFYLAGQYFQSYKSYDKENDYYHSEQSYAYASAHIRIRTAGYCLKMGRNFSLNNRWIVDIYAGLGERFLTTKYSQVTAGSITGSRLEENYFDDDRQEGWEKLPHVVLGFQFGYLIFQ